MMRTAISVALVLAACTPHRPDPPPPSRTWLSRWSGNNFDAVLGIAVTADGDTLAVGEGAGEMLFTTTGGPAKQATAPAIEMTRSGLFASYGPGGKLHHVFTFEITYHARGVAPTPDGGAMVVGVAHTPIVAGHDGIPVRKEPDGFIARFDAAGRRQWLHLVNGEDLQEVHHIVVHPQGGYVIAGIHGGESRFQGDPQAPAFAAPATFKGEWDVFLAHIDDDAHVRWIGELGGPGQDTLADLAIGRDGTTVLTGECRDRTVARGGARTAKIQCNPLSIGVYLATWTAAGELAWAARVPGPAKDTQTPEGVAITADGEVVAVGMFNKGLGGGPLPTLRNTRPMFVDGFAVRYTAAGAPKWIRHFRGSQLERVWAVAPAGTGAWVLAEPSADLEIGDGKRYEARPVTGSNAMLLRFDADGAITHAEPLAASGDTRATRLEIAPDGDLRIAGSFQGSLETPDRTAAISSVSELDGFILARTPPDAPARP
jgi:hypothetical protein